MGKVVHDDVEKASADASKKVVAEKARASPNEFDFAAKHPEHEHVEQDVPDVRDVVEKKIGEGLPDAKAGKNSGRNEAEQLDQRFVASSPSIVVSECFEDEDGEIGDKEKLHTRRDVKIEADAVVFDARACSHILSPREIRRGNISVRCGNAAYKWGGFATVERREKWSAISILQAAKRRRE